MLVATNPPNETERLRVLREHALLDSPPEPVFDELVTMAARVCEAPISLISLIDSDRQWFKARVGVTEAETDRSISLCAHAINHPAEWMIVPDATRDARFANNPLVTGSHSIRFYAGIPLRIGEKHAIGTLCVMDRQPRQLTAQQLETLRMLARQATTQIELRRARTAAETSEARYRMLFQQNPIPLYVFDQKTLRFLAVNDAATKRYGYTEDEFLQLTLMDLRPPEERLALQRDLAKHVHGLISVGRWRHRKKDGTIVPVDVFAHNMVFAGRDARIVLAVDASEQERAMTAFRASEERFQALSEAAPLGIFECDAEGRTTYCNPALLTIIGRTAPEVLGRGWSEAIHPEDRSFVLAEARRCLPAGLTSDLEHRVIRPDGTMRWVHLLASPQRDAKGEVSSFVGTVEDISEKRISEIAMLETEERYRKLLLLSPDAHFVHVDGTIIMVNQACCKLLGAEKPEQLIGRSLFQIIHHDFHDIARKRQQLVLGGQIAPPADQKFIRLDGTVVEVEVSASSVATDGRGRREIQVIARDNSARKAAEAALRDSEERFKLVARAVSDVVWDWNIATKTVWRSDSYETIFGLASSAAGTSSDAWKNRIHVSDRDRVVQSLQRAIASDQETWSEEYRFLRRDGSYAFVQDRGQIMRDAQGRAIRMLGGMTDLSERKKLELQYLRAQRMESIGTLAGGIAHDLNNVLAPILMSVDLLKLTTRKDSEEFKLLNTIQTSTRRGADLVKQVLSFARGLDGQRLSVNLRHLLTDVERIIGETFPRNIAIINDAAPDLWPVLGDPTQIHQVLLNLALNARDAMPDGGTLTFSAVNFMADTRFAGTTAEAKAGAYIVLSVHDSGTGIPSEIRDRIFEPFFTTKEVGKGTGLGLSTVHAILKSHGGFVNVFSEVGHGSTFKVYLPADLSLQNAKFEIEPPKEIPRGRGEMVLVIDDEASIRQITRQTLETFGYRVRTANDGAEAVALYPQLAKEISVVLTDMMMPVMDGQATIQVLQRLNPAVKIVAASGLNANENIARAAKVGVKDFLAKPYTAETLLRLLRTVIDRAAPAGK